MKACPLPLFFFFLCFSEDPHRIHFIFHFEMTFQFDIFPLKIRMKYFSSIETKHYDQPNNFFILVLHQN